MTIREETRSNGLILASFGAGTIVSILELECTGQVYLPTIGFVVRVPALRTHAILYLALYNLMFILPLINILCFTYFGTTWERLSGLLKGHLALIKIITVLFFFGLAALLITTVI